MLFLIRRVVPEARIVYTLHDYYPICANDGQMVTTDGHGSAPAHPLTPATAASPTARPTSSCFARST